jgi:hypothetical protein
MNSAVFLLALAGFAAAALRAGIALLAVIESGAESFLARDLEDVRRRRGDLTGLTDAAEVRSAARRRRLVALGFFSMWAGLLLIPPLTSWPQLLYAAYSVLWLVPRRRATRRRG